MSGSKSSALLLQHIKPLKKYFKTKGLVEICINTPGEIWLETMEGWQLKKDKELSKENLWNFAKNLATHQDQQFSEVTPILATSLPEEGYRIFIVAGGMAVGGFGLSMRVAQATRFTIENYMPEGQENNQEPEYIKKDDPDFYTSSAEGLKQAIIDGKTILVAGGTSSGKTTLLNSLIRYIPEKTRLISIEDSQELQIDQPNKLQMLKSKTGTDISKITYPDIINACMRMRPDRLIFGELDVESTEPFLRMINTGHGGSMATVHADSPERAIDAIVMNAQLNGSKSDGAVIERFARQSIDIIVHIKRRSRTKFIAKAQWIEA